MTPIQVRKRFFGVSGDYSRNFTAQTIAVAKGMADDGFEDFSRLLAATMFFTAPDLMEKVEVPQLGEGNDEIELMAAWLYWKQSVEENRFGTLSLMRQGAYQSTNKSNIAKAKRFWTIAENLGAGRVPIAKGSFGFTPWSVVMDISDIDEPIGIFRQTGMNRKGEWKGTFPAETTADAWSEPTTLPLETRITVPFIARGLPPFVNFNPKEAQVFISSEVKTDMNKLSISIADGAASDKNFNAPRALAVSLHDIIVNQQYMEADVEIEKGNEMAQAVVDYLLSAITIHDRKPPKWDGKTIKRAEIKAIRPAIFIGLAEAKLFERQLLPVHPAPQKFRMDLSKEEAFAVQRYTQWGNIKAGEKVPDGVRLPGV